MKGLYICNLMYADYLWHKGFGELSECTEQLYRAEHRQIPITTLALGSAAPSKKEVQDEYTAAF